MLPLQIKEDDYIEVVRIIADAPGFAIPDDRWELLRGALSGKPDGNRVLQLIRVGGSARSSALSVVNTLRDQGRFPDGQEALGVFLNFLTNSLPGTDRETARRIIDTYRLTVPIAPVRSLPAQEWRNPEPAAMTKEVIVTENTLQDVRVLLLALRAAAAVALVICPGGKGSGFLIAPTFLVTNNHVLESAAVARQTRFWFNYQVDYEGLPCPVEERRAKPGGVFLTNADLDYTLVELESAPPAPFEQPLHLQRAVPRIHDRVAIIQHAGGHYKQISFQNNHVAYAAPEDTIIQYTTTTLPGSSGSPVMNDDFEVVGIHHSGGDLREPGTERVNRRNAGTAIWALLDDVKHQDPGVAAQLKGSVV